MTQDESVRLNDANKLIKLEGFLMSNIDDLRKAVNDNEDFVRDQICHLSKGIQDNFLYTQQLEKRIAELEKEAKVVRFF